MKLRIQRDRDKHTVEIDDDDTIAQLYAIIKVKLSLAEEAFTIKAGYPPKPVTIADASTAVSSIFKTGESVIIDVKTAAKPVTKEITPNPINDESQPPEISVQGRGLLTLRVQPDDNSCLFRAVGYLCMRSIDAMEELRSLIATTIQSNPEEYNDAVLGMKRDLYAAKMNRADTWGGEIEMKILSDHFNIQIASIDCKTGHVYRYGEEFPHMIYLVYSGIHYDAIALSPAENAPPDWDQTQFDTDDVLIETAAIELVKLLRQRHYFTDTAGFSLRCQDCSAPLIGEKEAQDHAMKTGHINFGEYQGSAPL